MMRHARLLIPSICVLGLCLAVGAMADSEPYKIRWDMGFVPQKSEVLHTFYFTNTTDTALTIEKIKSGCSCTTIPIIEGAIAPGDSVAIPVTFRTGRYHYRVHKTTHITTDHPDLKRARLSFLAQVISDQDTTEFMGIDPRSLTWDTEVGQLKFEGKKVQLKNKYQDTVAVRVLEFPNANFVWELSDSLIAPNKSATLRLQPREGQTLPPGKPYSATLEFAGGQSMRATIPFEVK
jgi:hypothetical protein